MTIRINLVTNPAGRNVTGWNNRWFGNSGGAGNYASVTGASDGPSAVPGSYVRKTWTTASPSGGNGNVGFSVPPAGAVTVTPGQTLTLSGWFRASMGGLHDVRAKLYWQMSDGSFNEADGPSFSPSAGQWVQLSVTGVVPTGATGVFPLLDVDSNDVVVPAGTTFDATGALLELSGSVGTYFDGTSPGATWTGTADASTSRLATTDPVLTLMDDDNIGPRMQVIFDTLATGTQTVNVQRTAEGRTMKVRGGVNLFAVGAAAVLDNEVPFGIPVTYKAEQFDVNGLSLGFTNPSTITVDTTDTWVSQPLNPSLAVQVRVKLESTSSLTRPAPGSTVWTEGATVGRTISGQRTGIQGATILLRMPSPSDADLFDQLWGGYGVDYPAVICLRTPPNVPLPAVFFIGCTAPARQTYGANKFVVYSIPADEVAPPSPGLVLPLLRRKDIDAAFPTRAARAAAYSTRLARDTDYTKAGLAG